MAFTISIEPNNIGNMKAVVITATFTDASGANTLSMTPSTLGMNTIDVFLPEFQDIDATTAEGLFLSYDRTNALLEAWALSTADTLAAADSAVGKSLRAVAIGS